MQLVLWILLHSEVWEWQESGLCILQSYKLQMHSLSPGSYKRNQTEVLHAKMHQLWDCITNKGSKSPARWG